MKNIFILTLVAMSLSLSSCYKEPDHYLKIENGTDREIEIHIDDTIQHTLEITETTKLFHIEEGYHKIGGGFEGNFSISGEGYHEWTLTVFEDKFDLSSN